MDFKQLLEQTINEASDDILSESLQDINPSLHTELHNKLLNHGFHIKQGTDNVYSHPNHPTKDILLTSSATHDNINNKLNKMGVELKPTFNAHDLLIKHGFKLSNGEYSKDNFIANPIKISDNESEDSTIDKIKNYHVQHNNNIDNAHAAIIQHMKDNNFVVHNKPMVSMFDKKMNGTIYSHISSVNNDNPHTISHSQIINDYITTKEPIHDILNRKTTDIFNIHKHENNNLIDAIKSSYPNIAQHITDNTQTEISNDPESFKKTFSKHYLNGLIQLTSKKHSVDARNLAVNEFNEGSNDVHSIKLNNDYINVHGDNFEDIAKKIVAAHYISKGKLTGGVGSTSQLLQNDTDVNLGIKDFKTDKIDADYILNYKDAITHFKKKYGANISPIDKDINAYLNTDNNDEKEKIISDSLSKRIDGINSINSLEQHQLYSPNLQPETHHSNLKSHKDMIINAQKTLSDINSEDKHNDLDKIHQKVINSTSTKAHQVLLRNNDLSLDSFNKLVNKNNLSLETAKLVMKHPYLTQEHIKTLHKNKLIPLGNLQHLKGLGVL